MDNLVLIRVAQALNEQLSRARLRELRHEPPHRYRLIFETPEQAVRSILVSLRPELPWIGRPVSRAGRGADRPSEFAVRCGRALRGVVVSSVIKAGRDRVVVLRFADGHRLVAELATHGGNMVLIDPAGAIDSAARRPRSARSRLEAGEPYVAPTLPRGLFDPFDATAEEIDAFLEMWRKREETEFESLRRHAFGLGSAGAELVLAEAAAIGESHGTVLRRRLAELAAGESEPEIEASDDPRPAIRRGDPPGGPMRLLPWSPAAGSFLPTVRAGDAAATAGLFHEGVEREVSLRRQGSRLLGLIAREARRAGTAMIAAQQDLSRFAEEGTHRRWGEALLAGLTRARRIEGTAFVADPYGDAAAGEIAVPAPAHLTLQQAAERHFVLERRARRGVIRARQRLELLESRRAKLEELLDRFPEAVEPAAIRALEEAMQDEAIPVALEPDRRTRRFAASVRAPRIEGVRIFRTPEGRMALIGKGARENHRLTFKLAGPEDFWLHAQGCRGAHVVLRNEARCAEPSSEDLAFAASLAAWFSEARGQTFVDVQWTRRKYVRRPRGAPQGTVVLKRFSTIRVRPSPPDSSNLAP